MQMKLLIDTCSWIKFDFLKHLQLFTAENLYEWVDIRITHEILEELEYHKVNSCNKIKTTIIPISNKFIYQDALNCKLDIADASILSNGSKKNDMIIVSEDSELLEFAHTYFLRAIELIDLFLILTENGYTSKRTLYRIAKAMGENKNISKKKKKEIREWLQKNQ